MSFKSSLKVYGIQSNGREDIEERVNLRDNPSRRPSDFKVSHWLDLVAFDGRTRQPTSINTAEAEIQSAAWRFVTKVLKLPIFGTGALAHPPYIRVTLQGASSYIITSTLKVRLAKGAADVFLFMIWSKFWNSQLVIVPIWTSSSVFSNQLDLHPSMNEWIYYDGKRRFWRNTQIQHRNSLPKPVLFDHVLTCDITIRNGQVATLSAKYQIISQNPHIAFMSPTSGTQSPPLEATGEHTVMGCSSVYSTEQPQVVLDIEQRRRKPVILTDLLSLSLTPSSLQNTLKTNRKFKRRKKRRKRRVETNPYVQLEKILFFSF
jgi:hypothetical protein